jgi:hypothetical protein
VNHPTPLPPVGTHATVVFYAPGERPDVEVLIDGNWYPGELRMWTKSGVRWAANCSYRTAPGNTRLDTFDQDEVRPDVTEPRRVPPGL